MHQCDFTVCGIFFCFYPAVFFLVHTSTCPCFSIRAHNVVEFLHMHNFTFCCFLWFCCTLISHFSFLSGPSSPRSLLSFCLLFFFKAMRSRSIGDSALPSASIRSAKSAPVLIHPSKPLLPDIVLTLLSDELSGSGTSVCTPSHCLLPPAITQKRGEHCTMSEREGWNLRAYSLYARSLIPVIRHSQNQSVQPVTVVQMSGNVLLIFYLGHLLVLTIRFQNAVSPVKSLSQEVYLQVS